VEEHKNEFTVFIICLSISSWGCGCIHERDVLITWCLRAKGNDEEQVKPSVINHAKPCEDMDDQCHSFRYIFMPHRVELTNEQKLSAQY
jgi:hypothetical protein